MLESEFNIPRIYISALKKNSGKTTITIALNKILKKSNMLVQPFKKGPDFIDPMWHTIASGRKCRNIDLFLMDKKQIKKYFYEKCNTANIAIIEGNHGLFDDINTLGGNDNATLAKLLKTPIILVIDVKEIAGRSIIPLIIGCQQFDKKIDIRGIIINKIQNPRHEKKILNAIAFYTNIPVVGSIPEMKSIAILQRHLGLYSTIPLKDMESFITDLSEKIEFYLDLDRIIEIAKNAEPRRLDTTINLNKTIYNHSKAKVMRKLTLGLAYDEAFNFYYPDIIELFEQNGCEIKKFSPLRTKNLPEVDGIYIGGGFPELFLEKLSNNTSLKKDLKEFIESGNPVLAECGGLIYLTKQIFYNGRKSQMVDAIRANSILHKKPVGHGYTILEPTEQTKKIINSFTQANYYLKAHEFHHASISFLNQTPSSQFAFNLKRGSGIDGKHDGIIFKNTLASFSHLFGKTGFEFIYNWLFQNSK